MIKMQKQKRVFNTRGGWTLEWESPVAKNIKDILEFYGEHGEKELVRYWNDKMQRDTKAAAIRLYSGIGWHSKMRKSIQDSRRKIKRQEWEAK